jgi:hypothetical protein
MYMYTLCAVLMNVNVSYPRSVSGTLGLVPVGDPELGEGQWDTQIEKERFLHSVYGEDT